MSSIIHAGNITESIHNALSDRECSIFDKTLAGYHKRKDVNGFVEALALILNTNRKRQLLVPIRDIYIKPSDLIKFNDLAVKHGLALPSRGSVKKQFTRSESGPKVILIKRDKSGEWGFSLRGGADHGIGIFVGWVDPSGLALKAGLQIGDYIHRVNEMNVENLTCAEVEQILYNHRKVSLLVTSHGRVPGFQNANKLYQWVDREGQITLPPEEYDTSSLQLGNQPFPPLDPPIERKVTINVPSDKELGISIRGGAEHGLGVYISGVDFGSPAAVNGLRIGDQIMEVNGISFLNILHSDAAKTLKSQTTLAIRTKDVGKLPHSRIPGPVGQWNRYSQPPLPTQPPVAQPRTRRMSGDASSVKGSVIAHGEEPGANKVVLRKTTASAKDAMNDAARNILAKTEMSSLTYYISQYEHKQINIDELTINLLQLLNTNDKLQLLSEVRNVIKPEDLDAFNEMTLDKEINARKGGFPFAMGSKNSPSSGSEDGAAPKVIHHRPLNELDEIPQRESPATNRRQVPSFHIPPPPPGQPLTSVVSNDGWEETDGSGTLERQRKEKQRHLDAIRQQAEESMKREIEEQIRKEAEERIQREREEEERRRQEEIERERQRALEEQRRQEEERARREEERRREEEEEEQRREEERRRKEERARREAEERERREEEERQAREQEEQEDLSQLPEKERRKIERERARRAEERRLKRLREEEERRQQEDSSDEDDTMQRLRREEQRLEEPKHKEKELADQMLEVKLRNKQQKSTVQRAVSGGVSGKLMKVTIEKVNKKLGLAVDGGANTKQKSVIIRQIVPGGSAYETGHELEVGQHILFVNGQPLKNLNHKDAVMAIKTAFDGPIGKKVEFVVLDPDQ